MDDADPADPIRIRYQLMGPYLNERTRRIWAATEAKSVGWGGISLVSRATGLDRNTIQRGIQDLEQPLEGMEDRIRQPGGGRHSATETDPGLESALDTCIEPDVRGDPESPLCWVSKSTYKIAAELTKQGHKTSAETVRHLLANKGFSLQANRKTNEGKGHIDRDAQFQYINEQVKSFHSENQPVISVDAKKKELIGNFKNNGKEWHPSYNPEEVDVYDFPGDLGKVTPYGAYDISNNEGWVNVGIDHDTSEFAVHSIRTWWENMGKFRYPDARKIMITADCGGSNRSRGNLFKYELAQLAKELGVSFTVCHLPPGTSKWNKIEHRMFSFISMNWRGRPLTSYEVIVNLIASTTTRKGLKIGCSLDLNEYQTGIKLSDQQIESIPVRRHEFHGDWNYTIHPNHEVV